MNKKIFIKMVVEEVLKAVKGLDKEEYARMLETQIENGGEKNYKEYTKNESSIRNFIIDEIRIAKEDVKRKEEGKRVRAENKAIKEIQESIEKISDKEELERLIIKMQERIEKLKAQEEVSEEVSEEVEKEIKEVSKEEIEKVKAKVEVKEVEVQNKENKESNEYKKANRLLEDISNIDVLSKILDRLKMKVDRLE